MVNLNKLLNIIALLTALACYVVAAMIAEPFVFYFGVPIIIGLICYWCFYNELFKISIAATAVTLLGYLLTMIVGVNEIFGLVVLQLAIVNFIVIQFIQLLVSFVKR